MVKEKKRAKKREKKQSRIKKFFSKKRNVVIFVLAVLILISGSVLAVMLILRNRGDAPAENAEEAAEKSVKFFDNLTGETIAYSGYQLDENGDRTIGEDGNPVYLSEEQAKEKAAELNSKRINCVQVPNGTDARPQVGLSTAKIVYEAIAEGGITRFAALYQGDSSDVIGPVRSLRMYYLEWDIPYDCTIVHAGGVKAAVQRAESYAHLSESSVYMWRDYSAYNAPNNLFTSAELLNSFNREKGYTSSNPKVFARMTPDESKEELESIVEAKNGDADGETEEKAYNFAENISIHVTTAANYNVKYTYDAKTNSYLRAYEGNSGKHMTYTCENTGKSGSKIRPQKDCGAATQVAPKVVVVIKVDEALNQVNHYREEISTTGSGDAWIFQNGIAIEATWARSSAEAGLQFKDKKTGDEIKLAPGKTWITAIAKSYGKVTY